MGRGGMVQPAGNVEGHVRFAAPHQFGRHQSGPGTQGCRLVHLRVVRIVALKAEIEPRRLVRAFAPAQALDRLDILGNVQPPQFRLRSGSWADEPRVLAVEGPVALQQLVGIPQPHRPHWVVAPQFMARHLVIVYESRPGHDRPPLASRGFCFIWIGLAWTRPDLAWVGLTWPVRRRVIQPPIFNGVNNPHKDTPGAPGASAGG